MATVTSAIIRLKNQTSPVKSYRQGVVYATRYAELAFEHRGNHWRILDFTTNSDGSGIGPYYASKAELLADLDRYARDYGCTES